MKTKSFFIVVLFFIATNSIAQNSKHSISSGKVIFDVSYPESTMDEKSMANLPTESIMYFKNDKAKVEVNTKLGKTIIISDNKTGDGTMLMDMMGNKWAIKTNKAELDKKNGATSKPKVILTRDTKVIAGYSCTKAVVTFKTDKGEKSFDAWYTNELKTKNSYSSQIEGINGFMLEFYSLQNGMSMKMTARSVEKIDLADSEFEIPAGYEVKTMEEIQKGMGGGMH